MGRIKQINDLSLLPKTKNQRIYLVVSKKKLPQLTPLITRYPSININSGSVIFFI